MPNYSLLFWKLYTGEPLGESNVVNCYIHREPSTEPLANLVGNLEGEIITL